MRRRFLLQAALPHARRTGGSRHSDSRTWSGEEDEPVAGPACGGSGRPPAHAGRAEMAREQDEIAANVPTTQPREGERLMHRRGGLIVAGRDGDRYARLPVVASHH